MKLFSDLEKKAVSQCFWMLLNVDASHETYDVVSKITHEWEQENGSWIWESMQINPTEAFDVIGHMDDNKKERFKALIQRVVTPGHDCEVKARLASSLFHKMGIPDSE